MPTPAETATATPGPGATPTCANVPLAGCRTPALGQKATLQIKQGAVEAKDKLQWKWSKGSVTTRADFGDPTTVTAYQLCIYDGGGLILSAAAPAAQFCNVSNPRPCWRAKTHGFDYNDKDLTPDGVQQLKLKEGVVAGKASIQLKGKGALLDDPVLPLGSPVTVQLFNSDGVCWEAVYGAPFSKNTAGPPAQFKDKAD